MCRGRLGSHAGESPLLSRSGGEKGLRGSGAGTLGVPLGFNFCNLGDRCDDRGEDSSGGKAKGRLLSCPGEGGVQGGVLLRRGCLRPAVAFRKGKDVSGQGAFRVWMKGQPLTSAKALLSALSGAEFLARITLSNYSHEIKKHLVLGSHHSKGASQLALVVKNSPASAGDIRDAVSIPGSGRFPGRGHSNPLWYSCLENPMDKGAW